MLKFKLVISLMFALTSIYTLSAQDDSLLESVALPEQTSIKVMLDYTPNTNHIGLYAALAEGYYDAVNLDVEILEPADVFVETAIDTGIVEFGIGFQEFTTFAMASETDVVSIAAILQDNTSGFVTESDKYTLENPSDLQGLTYGGFSFPDLENAMLSQFLSCDDVEWDTNNYIDIGFADSIELMTRDRIDTAWIFYGWQGIQAELNDIELDVLLLSDYSDCVPAYYTPILLTSQEMIDTQPEVVRAFTYATAAGYQFAIENSDNAAQHLLDAVPELDPQLVEASATWLSDYFQSDADYWGYQSDEVWENFTQFLVDNDLIDDDFNIEGFYTNEFLPQAQ